MKHRKTIRKLEDSANGHVVLVLDKTRVIERHLYPTYGKAMWGVLALEEQYPGMEVEYRDVRSFREDDYGDH
jgi:hypothetical protein